MVRSIVGSLVCCCALIALRAAPAHACGGSQCAPDQFVPREGTVPANLPAIAWWGGDTYVRDDADVGFDRVETRAGDLAFECKAPGEDAREVEFDAASGQLRPKVPFVDGEQCSVKSKVVACDLRENADILLSLQHDLSYLSGVASFRVGPAAPLPATLGRFVTEPAAIDKVELSEGSGCNGVEEVCVVRGAIEFSDDARAWKDAFVYETRVDGMPWTIPVSAPFPREAGGSYLGRGKELVFARRPGARQLSDVRGASVGRHTIVLRAALPGTNIQFETAPVGIDLNCYASEPSPVDAGVDTADPDAGDAALADDAGEGAPLRVVHDAGDKPKPRRRPKRDSSCSATLAEPTALGGGGCATFAFVVLALVVRRRR